MSDSSDARVRLNPLPATLRELYLYSSNRCAFQHADEDCHKPLLREDGTWNCEVAHIHGVKPTAARGVHSLTTEQLRAPSNLVLMCREHHKVIDNKALEATYTVAVVEQMKKAHEERLREAMAGLERIVDISAGDTPTYPVNLRAIEGVEDELTAESMAEMRAFVDKLAKVPLAIRDLIALILIHGHLDQRFGDSGFRPGVGVSVVHIEATVNVERDEIERRAMHLEQVGLLSFFDDDGVYFFTLTDPIARDVGWDIFADLKAVAGDDAATINRAILDLDFTVLDR